MQPAGHPTPPAPGSSPVEESKGGEEPAALFAWLRSPAQTRRGSEVGGEVADLSDQVRPVLWAETVGAVRMKGVGKLLWL